MPGLIALEMKFLFREILFKEKDKRIKFDLNLLKRMKQYLQLQDETGESGGILLGFVSRESQDLLVTEMTVPYEGDESKRNRFVRKSQEHIKRYTELYESNHKTCLYVGEWHTHAEYTPVYSKIDEGNWNSISRKSKGFLMQIHVIAGTEAVGFWAVCNSEPPVLLDMILWVEVDLD